MKYLLNIVVVEFDETTSMRRGRVKKKKNTGKGQEEIRGSKMVKVIKGYNYAHYKNEKEV
jgi:hypothetical protein